MKRKITSLTTAIIVLFLILFTLPETGWGQTRTEEVYKTLTFKTSSNTGSNIQDYTSSWTETVSSFSWTITNFNTNRWGWTDGGNPALYIVKCGRKKDKSGNSYPSVATITTNAAIDQAITKVVVTLTAITSSQYNSIKLYMASTSEFDEENDDEFQTITVSPIPTSAGDMTITVPEALRAGNRYYKLEFDTKGTVAYSGANGHTGVTKVEYYKEAEAPAYTITAQSNNTNLGTVSLAGTVITGAPAANCRYASPAYTVEPANSATVVQDNENINKFTVTPTANTTVTINFEAIPQYAVTFSVNGTTSSQDYYEGATITFPDNPENIYGKTFVGWTTSAIEGTTNTPPTFVNTSEAITCAAAVTYYAVFADMTGSASPTLTKMTSEDTFVANDKVVIVASGTVAMYQETTTSPTNYVNKWSFDNNAATVAADNKKMFTVSAGSSTGTWKLGDATNGYVYNSSSNDLKIDKDNSTNFTLAWNSTVNQVEINKFTLIGNDRWLSYRSDLTNNYFRMGGATSGTAAGTVYFDIYKYSTGSVSYINYCTTVTPPAVEIPEIVITSNPFLFSTTVTITCGTEGSSIKYRYNENDSWSDYTAALTITETKTIYAKGVKGNDESLVAQATATKNLANPTVTVSGDLTLDLDGETSVAAGTLTAVVTYNNAAVEGATVTWGSNHTNIAEIDASTGTVTIKAIGEVTFTATYAGNNDYAEATGTKTVTVVNSKAPGTVYNPYTVAQARTVINALNDNETIDNQYVRGIISSVGSYNSTYYSITYWISDDGQESSELQVYSGKGISGADFAAASDLKTGDQVVVYGQLKKYVKNTTTTLEFNQNSQIYSLIRPGTNNNPTTIAGTFVNFEIENNESYSVASNTIFTVTGTLTIGPSANLIIEDGGQLICGNSVEATVKKSIANAGAKDAKDHWYTISSPIYTDTDANNNKYVTIGNETTVNLTNNGAYDMFAYEESTHTWLNQKEGSGANGFDKMYAGQGYMYRNSGNELSYVGNTTVGPVNIALSYTSDLDVADLKGFNLIGNPYTHSIAKGAGKAIYHESLSNGCYALTNSGTWTIIEDGAEIKPNQGVLVEVSEAVDNFQIKDINYVAPTPDPGKYKNDNIKFIVESSEYSDAAYAWFDKGIGLTKINHRNESAPMLYIPQDDNNYAIATMTDDTKAFNLNFKAATAGKYTLSYKATGNYNYLHVIDRLTGADVDMLLEGEYTFLGTPKDSENRFIVHLEYMPNYGEEGNDIFAYQSGSDIYVSGQGELQVFDVTGRRVMTTTINGAESISIPAQGVYIFKLNEKVQKIVVR